MTVELPSGVIVKAEEDTRKVFWMSDWSRCDELARAGELHSIFHAGHGDPVAQYVEFFVR